MSRWPEALPARGRSSGDLPATGGWPVALPAVLPWTVLSIRGSGIEFVFAWGILNTAPLRAVPLSAYLLEHTMGLPDRLLAWPVGVLLYLLAVASALAGALLGREDARLTAGLFALAGASCLVFTLGISRRNPDVALAVPAGTLVLWAVAWRSYRPAIGGER